jgi:uncharacterized RDD family membrane protein YckC
LTEVLAACWDPTITVRGGEAEALDNTVDVETPERIRFRHHVAGPVRRGLAFLLDLLLRVLLLLIAGIIAAIGGFEGSMGLWLILLFAIEWGWNVLFETFWRGQTPGKRALRLRVVREGGFPVGFIDSVLRNLLRAADFLPLCYVLGLLVMAGDRRFRRLGDRVAATMVIIEETGMVAAPLALVPPATADELGGLPHRPPVSVEESEALEMFRRRTHLSDARRVELAEMVAPTLAARMGLRVNDPARFLALVHERSVGARKPAPTARPGGR